MPFSVQVLETLNAHDRVDELFCIVADIGIVEGEEVISSEPLLTETGWVDACDEVVDVARGLALEDLK